MQLEDGSLSIFFKCDVSALTFFKDLVSFFLQNWFETCKHMVIRVHSDLTIRMLVPPLAVVFECISERFPFGYASAGGVNSVPGLQNVCFGGFAGLSFTWRAECCVNVAFC